MKISIKLLVSLKDNRMASRLTVLGLTQARKVLFDPCMSMFFKPRLCNKWDLVFPNFLVGYKRWDHYFLWVPYFKIALTEVCFLQVPYCLPDGQVLSIYKLNSRVDKQKFHFGGIINIKTVGDRVWHLSLKGNKLMQHCSWRLENFTVEKQTFVC